MKLPLKTSAVLQNGNTIPLKGLGTWQSKGNDLSLALNKALDIGYRHIDTAAIYGNEKDIGQVLKSAIKAGRVKRSDLFVTSKLWNTEHAPENVLKACQKSLDDLQLDYLDLYLIHWPFAFNEKSELLNIPLTDTWKAMEKLVSSGKVKSIGVSNFQIHHLKKILEIAQVHPQVNQFELHPYHRQEELIRFCKENSIHVTAYSPFGSGKSPAVLEDKTLIKLSQQENCKVSNVILSWLIQKSISVIPKSSNADRLLENFDLVSISESATKEIDNITENHCFFNPLDYWGYSFDRT